MSPSADLDRELSHLERKLGRSFREPRLLRQALTHKSHAYESGEDAFHNESLEFLGDAVLGFVVTDIIYRAFPDLPEGRKSKIKAHLVSTDTLSSLATELNLPDYLRLGRGEEKTGGRKKRALGANAFEAVVAAVYLDGGLEAVRSLLEPLYLPLVGEIRDRGARVEDPKTALQELLQARGLGTAHYVVQAETGPAHQKTFHVDLFLGKQKIAEASGPTKKKASLEAARTALARLRREIPAEPI